MRRNKLLGLICILLGLLILVSCLGWQLQNRQTEQEAAQQVQRTLTVLEARQRDTVEVTAPVGETTLTDPTDPPTLSSEILDGREYVGYLIFPSLDRKLPVMKIRYLEDLQIAPCLENGSPYTDDAVISAHNYPSHFGPIRDWVGGEEVVFSSLDGKQIHYTVTLVKTIGASDVDAVRESGHDLVLYTCTTGGQKRVMIACDRPNP